MKSLNKQIRGNYAISRTAHSVNLIDIAGKTVHQFCNFRNMQTRNSRLVLMSMEGSGDKDDLFKIFFINESVSNLHSNQKKDQFKSFFGETRTSLPTIKEENEGSTPATTKVKLKQVTLQTSSKLYSKDETVRMSTDQGEIPRARTP